MGKRKREAARTAADAWQAEVKAKLDELAVYNAERKRGIVHTPEWVGLMVKRQGKFDEDTAAQAQWEAESFAAGRRKQIGLPPNE